MNASAIDLGTNSIKILIVRRDSEGHMHVLFRHRSVVRLGEGTFSKDGKGKIPRNVQLRTLKVFQSYAKFLSAYHVDVVRATGTSALRDSKNGLEFVKEVRDKTGIALEVLPADEEARLIVKGVSSEMPIPRKPTLFIDIGGGSCEISLVNKKKIEKFVSLPLGAVRLTELYVPQPKPDTARLRRLDQFVQKTLSENWPQPKMVNVAFGSAGTIRALGRLVSKTELSDSERLIKRRQLDRAVLSISKMSTKRIAALPGVDSKRAEILTAGTHVLKGIFDYFRISHIHVSNRGLREGILIDLFEKPQKPLGVAPDKQEEEKLEFLDNIGRHYHSNRNNTYQVWRLARSLFDELVPVHGLPISLKPILMTAALLHDVGKYVSETSSHKHSYYIIKNTPLPFFNEKEAALAAILARYHRKSPPREGHEGYDQLNPDEKRILEKLAAILRLAVGLDARQDQSVKWLKCQWGPGKIRIRVELKLNTTLDMVELKQQAKLFEDQFKMSVVIESLSADEFKNSKPVVVDETLGARSV